MTKLKRIGDNIAELEIKPINNINLDESGADGPTICIVKCKTDVCDSCDGICFLGS